MFQNANVLKVLKYHRKKLMPLEKLPMQKLCLKIWIR